jgi:hypothetical protein
MRRSHRREPGAAAAISRQENPMKNGILGLAGAFALACSLAAAAAEPKQETMQVKLAAADIVAVGPDKSMSRKQFDEAFGEIGIVVRRDKFPLPAPNCKHDVMVRLPELDKGNAAAELNRRWATFQQIQASLDKSKPLELTLITKPYLKPNAAGKYELSYCSAYFLLK